MPLNCGEFMREVDSILPDESLVDYRKKVLAMIVPNWVLFMDTDEIFSSGKYPSFAKSEGGARSGGRSFAYGLYLPLRIYSQDFINQIGILDFAIVSVGSDTSLQ